MNIKYIPSFIASCGLKSKLSLEELGELLSDKVFFGLKFEGREDCIHEEIPAIYIKQPVFGMLIVLDQSPTDDQVFGLDIEEFSDFSRYRHNKDYRGKNFEFHSYLYHLVCFHLGDNPLVEITCLSNNLGFQNPL